MLALLPGLDLARVRIISIALAALTLVAAADMLSAQTTDTTAVSPGAP